jgi:hypothetical protein
VNEAPEPGADVTSSSAPSSVAFSRAMARPSPLPPPERAASPREKRSNRLGSRSGGIPGPWSETSAHALSPSGRALTPVAARIAVPDSAPASCPALVSDFRILGQLYRPRPEVLTGAWTVPTLSQ